MSRLELISYNKQSDGQKKNKYCIALKISLKSLSAVYLSAATNIYPNAAQTLLCTALMYLHLMFQQETSSVQEFWLSFLSFKIISVCLFVCL